MTTLPHLNVFVDRLSQKVRSFPVAKNAVFLPITHVECEYAMTRGVTHTEKPKKGWYDDAVRGFSG